MKTACSIGFALLLAFGMVSSAEAVDEGQTQPKLNSKAMSSTEQIKDLIPLTSGSGNVKGVLCKSASSGLLMNAGLQIYVDGAPVHTLAFGDHYPFSKDSEASYSTGVIPMNVRFESSIRVVMYRSSTSTNFVCMASWGLD